MTEWEAPKRPLQKPLFAAIRASEPSGFTRFLCTDMPAYFAKNGLTVATETHCDCSRMFELIPK